MPIYEYECDRCGRFENIEKLGEEPLKECPNCAKQGVISNVRKLVSAAAFHLKGNGWYKTDYANGSSCSSHNGGKVKDCDKTCPAQNNQNNSSDSEKSCPCKTETPSTK